MISTYIGPSFISNEQIGSRWTYFASMINEVDSKTLRFPWVNATSKATTCRTMGAGRISVSLTRSLGEEVMTSKLQRYGDFQPNNRLEPVGLARTF